MLFFDHVPRLLWPKRFDTGKSCGHFVFTSEGSENTPGTARNRPDTAEQTAGRAPDTVF